MYPNFSQLGRVWGLVDYDVTGPVSEDLEERDSLGEEYANAG